MKTFCRALAIVAGLLTGCALGVNEGQVWFGGVSYLSETFAKASYENYAYLQYRRAGTEQARSALLGCARFTDELDMLRPSRTLKADAALSFARLAVLERSAGNLEQSELYFALAQEWFRAAGPNTADYSEARITGIVEKIDQTTSY